MQNEKSRNTRSNRQIWPWNAEWSKVKANRVLQRECIGHSKHPFPKTQEKTLHMDITRWSTPKSDWLYSMQQRWKISIQSTKTRPGADCGSDHELLIAKFRLNFKKVGKTTRPFRAGLLVKIFSLWEHWWGFSLMWGCGGLSRGSHYWSFSHTAHNCGAVLNVDSP